jgi:hypothetical protein
MEIIMSQQNTQVNGEEIQIGNEKYVLAPLPLIKMASVKRLMSGGDFMGDDEYVQSLINAIYWSLLRNYPTLDRAVVENGLDMTNFQPIMNAFMSVNGFANKPSDAEAVAGEAVAS